MTVEKTYSLTPVGVGRKDNSVSVESSVESIIRSHLTRYSWNIDHLELDTLPAGYDYGALLGFLDLNGNLTYYVPSDVSYYIYEGDFTGDSNALSVITLWQYSYPDLVLIKTVLEYYGYLGASFRISKGHKAEAGKAYYVGFSQWSANPTFNASLTVYAMSSQVAGQ